MRTLRYILRHSAETLGWQLVNPRSGRQSRHYATHTGAFSAPAADPDICRSGATVEVHGADGGYVCERTFPASGAILDSGESACFDSATRTLMPVPVAA